MGRENYDVIREKFHSYLECLRTRNTDHLENLVTEEVKVYLSTVAAYPDGSQHSLYGIRDFIRDQPATDGYYYTVCNYVCHVAENRAQQSASVFFHVYKNEGKGFRYFDFTQMYTNTWEKMESGWKMTTIRMDLMNHTGDYKEFEDCWFYEEPKAKWFPGVHLPCISGELDNPWHVIPESQEELTEEEKIAEAMACYAYGIDTVSFDNLPKALSEDIVVNMQPWGTMDYRLFIATLKYHRQPDRYWTHPVKLDRCEVHGDTADLYLYRMSGHAQRKHPLVYTNENKDHAFACARYEIQLRKESGVWKLTRMDYLLGLIDLGPFEEK